MPNTFASLASALYIPTIHHFPLTPPKQRKIELAKMGILGSETEMVGMRAPFGEDSGVTCGGFEVIGSGRCAAKARRALAAAKARP